jgi:hypothetical protein
MDGKAVEVVEIMKVVKADPLLPSLEVIKEDRRLLKISALLYNKLE